MGQRSDKRPALGRAASLWPFSVGRDEVPFLVCFVGTAVYEDDDPVLRDAFDACDADGDGRLIYPTSWTVWKSKFTARSSTRRLLDGVAMPVHVHPTLIDSTQVVDWLTSPRNG